MAARDASMSQPEMLVTINGPLTADVLVDAHLKALATGARLVVQHDGSPTLVALRTAERFGIELRPALSPPPALPPTPEMIVAHDEPAPEVAHSDDAMPWGSAPLVEAEVAHAPVEPIELLAFPWIANAEPSDEHHDLTHHERTRRGFAQRPTTAPSWDMPWRPGQPSTEAIALNDPRIWRGPERMLAIRSDLDKIGAPSFGAVKKS